MTQIERLDQKHECLMESIPAKALKEDFELLLPCLNNTYNSCILQHLFIMNQDLGIFPHLVKR